MAGSCRNWGGVVGSGATAGTTLNCMIWPVEAGSADRKIDTGNTAAKGFVRTDVAQHVVAQRNVGEVDDQVGTLGQAHEQTIAVGRREVHRRGQETALVADGPHLDTGNLVEVQDQEARLAAVEEAEAVAPLLDGLEGPGVAVDHHHVAEELGVPDRRELAIRDEVADDAVEEFTGIGVEQRAVSIEGTVLDGDGDFVVGLVGRKLVVFLGCRVPAELPGCRPLLSSTTSSGPPRMR